MPKPRYNHLISLNQEGEDELQAVKKKKKKITLIEIFMIGLRSVKI